MTRSNKELIALNLLTYPTSKEAAEKSGVSITTIYRLKKDKAFHYKRLKIAFFKKLCRKRKDIAWNRWKCYEKWQRIRTQRILQGFRLQGLFWNLESAYMRMKTLFGGWMRWKEG